MERNREGMTVEERAARLELDPAWFVSREALEAALAAIEPLIDWAG